MVHNRTTNFWNLAAQFFLGSITLASVAFLRLGVDLASTAFVYLIVIVLFALMVVVAFWLNSSIVMGLVEVPASERKQHSRPKLTSGVERLICR